MRLAGLARGGEANPLAAHGDINRTAETGCRHTEHDLSSLVSSLRPEGPTGASSPAARETQEHPSSHINRLMILVEGGRYKRTRTIH